MNPLSRSLKCVVPFLLGCLFFVYESPKLFASQVSRDSTTALPKQEKKTVNARASVGFDQFWGSWISGNVAKNLDSTGWIKSYELYLQGWQNPALGNGLGSDPWVEFGTSVTFHPVEEVWFIKPSFGITAGRFLVSSSFGNFAESFTISLQNELKIFGVNLFARPKYYFVLFNRGKPSNDLFLLCGGIGYDFSTIVIAELRGEWLGAARSTTQNNTTYYQRVGFALRYDDRKLFAMEFEGGFDFAEQFSNGNYYRWMISLGF
ncbi:MAG: DUF6733 family protein [Chloroherpetonaceae bacterium]|nr:DUF6733 family protein [Chloroherpetonaceae bacterium]